MDLEQKTVTDHELPFPVNKGAEPEYLPCPAQLTLSNSTESLSTQVCQAGSDKLLYHFMSTI